LFQSISGDRLQGTNVLCTTQSGDVNVKAIYAVESFCGSKFGNVSIRDCHGDMAVTLSGGNMNVGKWEIWAVFI
jgi:hypothetical protein